MATDEGERGGGAAEVGVFFFLMLVSGRGSGRGMRVVCLLGFKGASTSTVAAKPLETLIFRDIF